MAITTGFQPVERSSILLTRSGKQKHHLHKDGVFVCLSTVRENRTPVEADVRIHPEL